MVAIQQAVGHNVDRLCLRIESFDEAALIAILAAHGLAATGKAGIDFGAEGDGLSLHVTDPDGTSSNSRADDR